MHSNKTSPKWEIYFKYYFCQKINDGDDDDDYYYYASFSFCFRLRNCYDI